MPQRVGVYSPETATMVLAVIEELKRAGFVTKSGAKSPANWAGTTSIIAETPGGGIAASTGATPGTASCEVIRIDDAGDYANVLDNQGANAAVDIYHFGSTAVAGNARIVAVWSFGRWVVVAEDCG